MKVLLVHDKDLSAVRLDAPREAGDVSSPRAGGLAVYLATVTRALRESGTGVTTLGFSDAPSTAGDGQSGYTLPAFRFRYQEEVVRRVEAIVAEEQPDVIHLQSVTSIHPTLVARLRALRPVVWTFHDVSGVCFWRTLLTRSRSMCDRALGFGCVARGCYTPGALESLPRDLARLARHRHSLRAFRDAATVSVPSQYLADVLVRNGLDPECITVTPLFARFELPQPTAAPEHEVPHLLFAGRVSADKGVPELLTALGRLCELPWTATLAGAGPLSSTVDELSAKAGIGGRVRAPGELSIEALSKAFRTADLVLVPSIAPESFGLVGVEAMAHARPVVAFDAGGIREWLQDGRTGLLAAHGDVDQFAQHVRRLLNDAAERRAMGHAAFESQRARFTQARHIEALAELYERAASGRRRVAS